MMRSLKTLAVAIVAVLSVSAVSAATASAAQFVAGNGSGKATFKLEQLQKAANKRQTFTMDPASFKCTYVSGEDVEANATTDFLDFENLTFQDCRNQFEYPATISNTCHFILTASGDLTIGPAGCQINMNTSQYNCLVTIESQVFSEAIKQTSQTGASIWVQLELTGIAYSWTGVHCFGGYSGTKANGTYSGWVKVTAFTPGGEALEIELVK